MIGFRTSAAVRLCAIGACALAYAAVAQATPRNETIFSFSGGDGSMLGLNIFSMVRVGLVADRSEALYGVTPRGGSKSCGGGNCGTIFRLVPPSAPGKPWTHEVLYEFQGGADGAIPIVTPVMDEAGNLYGTTQVGGSLPYGLGYFQGNGGGVLWQLAPPAKSGGAWTFTVLHTFATVPYTFNTRFPIDGSRPTDLAIDPAGTLFGTTELGGAGHTRNNIGQGGLGYGIVFSLRPQAGGTWTYHTVYRFEGTLGAYPDSLLVAGGGNWLFGTSSAERSSCAYCQVLFLLHHTAVNTWEYTAEDYLSESTIDSSLLRTSGRTLLYTSSSNAALPEGSVQELTSTGSYPEQTWTQQTIFAFPTHGAGAAYPNGGLTRDRTGQLFGVTYSSGGAPAADGSTGKYGVTYRVDPPASAGGPWQYTALHAFTGDAGQGGVRPDGATPAGTMVFGWHHLLYGITVAGGRYGHGTIFQQTPE